MKRLVIVADNAFVARIMRLGLRQTAGFRVLGVIDGREPAALRLLEHEPDVALVGDMQDPTHTLARLREIARVLPDSRSLLLTARMDESWLGQAFDAGAHAVISRSVHPVSLGTLLREIACGNVVQRYTPVRERKEPGARCPLTPRELEILRLAAQGHTNGRIARELVVTEQTVKFHLSNTYRKLGVANRTEASRYAHANALIDLEDERLAS
jgi:DNA-binding NarL/FixJ family response regulator